MHAPTWLAALPVFNEVDSVDAILDQVIQYADHVLVVDDGSTDGTSERLARRRDIRLISHQQNLGYGAALRSAFKFTLQGGFEGVVTLDCDGQHQPQRIPRFIKAAEQADIVSGSRYLKHYPGDDQPPADRLFINRTLTDELNRQLGLQLTDAFCGFKAYARRAIEKLEITETGYAMPLELWVQAAYRGLSILEIPVPLIYLDLTRSFGGALDDNQVRLAHYREVLERSTERMRARGLRCESLPGRSSAAAGH